MDTIVKRSLKIDFHIHSCHSLKDGDLVKDGTINNIGTLIEKLNENDANMVSITDHNNFNYELYKRLKLEEKNNNSSIKKVFPGIEFTVEIGGKLIDFITIFDDTNETAIQNIEKAISSYANKTSISIKEFQEKMETINVDAILIAHQKGPLNKQREKDYSSLPSTIKEELLFVNFFDAYEFKNKWMEKINKLIAQKEKFKNFNLITGSDCHVWNAYPNYSSEMNDATKYTPTFLKCLPSFIGLKLAITNPARIQFGNSFFTTNPNSYINDICLSINGKKQKIELSKGINAIIGDNSVGKSFLLMKLVENYQNQIPSKIVKGYENFSKKQKIELLNTIPINKILNYDSQGRIKQYFYKKQIGETFLSKYYGEKPNYDAEIEYIKSEICKFCDHIKAKWDTQEKYNQLPSLKLMQTNNPDSLTLTNSLKEKKIDAFTELLTKIKGLIDNIDSILSKHNNVITKSFSNKAKVFKNQVNQLKSTIKKQISNVSKCNLIISAISESITKFQLDRSSTITSRQSEIQSCLTNKKKLVETIASLVIDNQTNNFFKFNIEEKNIQPVSKAYGKYNFVWKCSIDKIDNALIIDLISNTLPNIYSKKIIKNNSLLFDAIEPFDFFDNCRCIEKDALTIDKKISQFKDSIFKSIDERLTPIQSISDDKNDITKEMSSGLNSQVYFELLSYSNDKNGIYLVDQPEDDVSQSAIKEKIIDFFRKISINHQIILVTHNPQFVVNLDVDNVIFIKNNGNNISIINGALEYKNDDVDMLSIVANNLDGGKEAIEERYRKYGKEN